LTVEIDNTDAEGRLVLADALDVAVNAKGKDAPAAVINLATLTGAMRIALGTRLAGMFSTDDHLAGALLAAGQRRADPAWRMPLWMDYLSGLKSVVADIANSGPSRFGGAITAALFLQRFVGQTPWAHFDMYAWTDANVGGAAEVGGNGQCIQLLSDFLLGWEDSGGGE
jgi:leucyl aminopeptidase